MTYAELMSKIKKGEPLTTEEASELDKLSRPAERFNEVSAKAQKLESELKAKEKELEQLKAQMLDESQKLQDEVQRQLAELSGKVETLSAEKNSLLSERDDALKSLKVRDLAVNNPTGAHFADPEYLKYLLNKEKVDLDNEEQVKSTMLSLKERYPEQFRVPAKGGSGAGAGNVGTQPKPATKPAKDWTDADKAKFIREGGTVEQFQALIKTEV
jgi:ABC-type transporter Mla subunit MlaD